MNKFIKLVSIAVLTVGVLAACNSDDKEENATPDDNDDVVEENNTPGDDNETNDEEQGNEAEEDETENRDNSASDEQFAGQLDLRLGDTGRFSDTVGAYEITIHSVKKEDEVDGKPSQLDYFLIVDLTIKNIGDSVIDAEDTVGVLDQSDDIDLSVSDDISHLYESIEQLSGELSPGEEITGQALFHSYDNDQQYLKIREGLIAAGAVYNQVIWTIDKSEIE
ncbi:protein of unknown function [Evansella caseinilytica]|uniref:DUF4352 domain-containing protein n=1 Tax=Evansella caseinilytica TaxID=1503961 RepID=A0A1H3QYN4_9BACI|nr:DUF4352 domain-containing protein [Evansella caseinilytica]SDZ18078.1 protein of unknown function [Evansella caseinilytica]